MIVNLFSKIESKEEMNILIQDLLTPQEITEIAERVKMVRQLKEGKTQRAIAKDLGVSVTTVNRASRMLQYGSWGFRELI